MNRNPFPKSTSPEDLIRWAAQGHIESDGAPAVVKTPNGGITLCVDGSATVNNSSCNGTALYLLPGNRKLAFATGQPDNTQVHIIPVADFRLPSSIVMT